MNSVPACLTAILLLGSLTGCGEKPQAEETETTSENVAANERAAAAKLAPATDPIEEEIEAFRTKTRVLYNNSNFDELEKIAEDARSSKARFANGSWKLYQFYAALVCDSDEPEEMWELHDQIHKAWIAAKPDSITARVAHADFLVTHAWHARGDGYADSVTPEGWKSFGIRLNRAAEILEKAQTLSAKDPYLWDVSISTGKGLSWEKPEFEAIIAQAVAQEPKFFAVDINRSLSLLPRWLGEPGDWEAYAQQASERQDGLGAEVYARIVIYLAGYHDNIFRETKASWPRTKEGLKLMRERYPDSIKILSQIAKTATAAEDREFAKASFDQLGDVYLPSVWRKPERFIHYRNWAETGQW